MNPDRALGFVFQTQEYQENSGIERCFVVLDSAPLFIDILQLRKMLRLIKELRRREVFRTVGLYVGIGWITIEAASVMLPAFDAPEWVLRAVIILAIIGLPVAIVLAWIYDVTDSGIVVQADPTDTVVIPFGGQIGRASCRERV